MNLARSHIPPQTDYFGSNLEITEAPQLKSDVTNQKLAKSPLNSLVHHRATKIGQAIARQPRMCQLGKQSFSENPVNVFPYQLKDYQIREVHLNNIRQNLEHRLQRAKAQGNRQLVASLNKEFQEISTN